MFEIGNSLREARLARASSSRRRAATKIRPKYLRALEDEQFELLPAQTYVKGFLNTYAEFLGLDGQLYVDEYNPRYVTREDEERFRPRRSTPGPRNRRLESSVVLVTLVGIAVVPALVIAVEVRRRPAEHERADRRHRAARTRPSASWSSGARGATRMEVRHLAGRRAVFSGTIPNGRDAVVQDLGRAVALRATSCGRRPGRQRRATRAPARLPFVDVPSRRRARPRPRIDAPAGAPRRHRQRARPRRADRPERAFPRAGDLERGLEPARITIVGDGEHELEAALREGLAADLFVTSGGLGPTHDDRTVELLARVTGRELRVDDDLEGKIERVSRGVAERLRATLRGLRARGTEAGIGAGRRRVGRARRAPRRAWCSSTAGRSSWCCPGRPANCSGSGPRRSSLSRCWSCLPVPPPGRRALRLFGVSESAVSRALEEAGGEPEGVEATICARDFEIHVDLVVDPGAERGRWSWSRRLPVARALAVRPRRADDRGARARALPRLRADRDRRVLHGRPRRGAADAGARLERRLPRGDRGLLGQGENGAAGRPGRR